MTTRGGGRRRAVSEEERQRAEEQRRETLELLHEQLSAALGRLSGADEWQAWLRFSAGFTRYSMNNSLLIMMQTGGEATAVAGYRAWQAKGRQVRRGEKAIKILAPVVKRIELVDAQDNPVLDENGRPRRADRLVGVRVASVFDVSSTDGPPIPEAPRPQLLRGEAPEGLWNDLALIVAERGYSLSRGDCGGANGWTNYATREIRVRDDVDDAQAVKTLIHELAHADLHEPSDGGSLQHRGIKEVEAESVAYLVLEAHGIDSAQYTFNYVVGWAESATTPETTLLDVVRRTGDRVIATASRILTRTQPAPSVADEAGDALEAQVIGPDRATGTVLPVSRTDAVAARRDVARSRSARNIPEVSTRRAAPSLAPRR